MPKAKAQALHHPIEPFPQLSDLLQYPGNKGISFADYQALTDEEIRQFYLDCSQWLASQHKCNTNMQ